MLAVNNYKKGEDDHHQIYLVFHLRHTAALLQRPPKNPKMFEISLPIIQFHSYEKKKPPTVVKTKTWQLMYENRACDGSISKVLHRGIHGLTKRIGWNKLQQFLSRLLSKDWTNNVW